MAMLTAKFCRTTRLSATVAAMLLVLGVATMPAVTPTASYDMVAHTNSK
jgi:hypothetical protein